MAVTTAFYDSFVEALGDGTHDLDLHDIVVELCNAYTYSAAHTQRSDWSATALATLFGYINPGDSLATITWSHSGATTTFDAVDTTWTASGGSIGPATDAIIYNQATTVPVDAGILAIDFGASETAGDGTDFKLTYNVSGIFTAAS